MAVDRGGLNYRIQIRDEFSKTTAKFRSELRASKAAFAEFQKGVSVQRDAAASFKKTTKAIDENKEALGRLVTASRRQRDVEREAVRLRNTATRDARERLTLLRQEQQDLKALVDAQNRAQKEAAKISAAMRKDRERVQRGDAQIQAQKRLNQAVQEELITRQQISLLRKRAVQQFASGDILGGAKSVKQARELQTQLQAIGKTGSQLFFTFRRLVGVLALFTIARGAVQGFQDLVRLGLDFNNKLETARTSIAGLIVATTDVRNKFGQTVSGAEGFAMALKAAGDQVKKLRVDATRTVATFEQLIETFQIAVAPGFAAGLNLDQIRKLTVDISQAAAAIGLQQNQLAEEIRSLLSGTIQARTTRIATALGITNADIKRLKETGKLFDFLQERFKGFNEANERLVRTTLSGVRGLIQNTVQQILGEAAEPLFKELIDLGNEFLDKIRVIDRATNTITVNPKVVAAFKSIFDALRDGLLEVKQVAQDLGLDNLQVAFAAAGIALSTSIKFALGFAQAFLNVFLGIIKAVRAVAQFLGLTDRSLGKIAGTIGGLVALTFAWNNTFGLLGLRVGDIFSLLSSKFPGALRGIIGQMGLWAAVLAAIGVGFKFVLDDLFDVKLTLAQTIKLLQIGLVDGLKDAALALKTTFLQFKGAFTGQTQEAIDAEKMKAVLERVEAERKANEEIAKIIAEAAERANRGPGFDPFAKTKKSAEEFKGFLSGIDRQVQDLESTLKSLGDELFKTRESFREAFNGKDLQGVGAQIQSIFADAAVDSAVAVKKARAASLAVEKQITAVLKERAVPAERLAQLEAAASGDLDEKAIATLKITEAEGQLVSLLQDRKIAQEAINEVDQQSLELAQAKTALLAVQVARDLNREAVVLQKQLAAEKAITDVQVRQLGARRQATVEAQNAVNLARLEQAQAEQSLQAQIDFIREKVRLNATLSGPLSPTQAAERQANIDLLAGLERQLELQRLLGAEALKQLEIARQRKALEESGTFAQGVGQGFRDLVDELPTAFEAAVTIVKQSVTSLADFISTSIVQAFDPTQDASLVERFARFLQGIAQIILQQIIQLAIQSAIQKQLANVAEQAAAVTTAGIIFQGGVAAGNALIIAATTAAGILAGAGALGGGLSPFTSFVGANKGGRIPEPQGFKRGGMPRPASIHPQDTVSAWLTPGEFVLRKPVVDKLDLSWLENLNRGKFTVPAAPISGAHAADTAGMAKGGLVSDQTQRASVSRNSDTGVQILPAVVAGEKEMDRLTAGGKSAMLRFMRTHAGTINGILKGGR